MTHAVQVQATRETERIVLANIATLPADGSFVEVSKEHPAWDLPLRNRPERTWTSRRFTAQLYPAQDGAQRLSIQRTRAAAYIRPQKRDLRPISWDELMAVKRALGFASSWAVEVLPPDADVVNVCSMRHVFLVPEPPPYAWRR